MFKIVAVTTLFPKKRNLISLVPWNNSVLRGGLSTIEGQFKVKLCKKGIRHREKAISRSDECYYNPIILINDLIMN